MGSYVRADQRAESATRVHPDAIAAAKAAGLHDAVMQLPNAYKTVLQPRGAPCGHTELDNAQQNLLALARKNYRVRAKHAALRHTDTLWSRPATRGRGGARAGVVPDFAALHTQWEAQLSAARHAAKEQAEATCPQVRRRHGHGCKGVAAPLACALCVHPIASTGG